MRDGKRAVSAPIAAAKKCQAVNHSEFVIASRGRREASADCEAIHIRERRLDCFVATAPRNDELKRLILLSSF
jgi:hypothetical protein